MGNPGGLPDGFFLCCVTCCKEVPANLEEIPSRAKNPGDCGTHVHTNECFCLLFYHPKPGESHEHTRHLALPDKNGNVKRDPAVVYEYRCVSPVLEEGAGEYKSLCGDPVLRKDPADPNSSAMLIECPKECSGKACTLFYSSGSKWKPVEANDAGTDKKFSESARGQLKIEPDELDKLRKKMMFLCLCV